MTEPRDEARDVLADELDGHLPRMAFQMYGRFYTDDPGFDIESYYQRVAAEMIEALAARGYRLVPEPAPDVEAGWPVLANIIREVDGNHDLGAGELAQRILEHPRFRSALAGEVQDALRAALHPADPSRREP